MAKKVTGIVKLQLSAGKANPAPPVGPALGPHGVNIMAFCKEFNAKTQGSDMIIPVVLTVYSDRSFSMLLKTPPTSVLLKKAAGLSTGKKPGAGSKEPNKTKVGKVTMKQVRELAAQKMPDMNCTDIESAIRTVKGTARSMGIDVEGSRPPHHRPGMAPGPRWEAYKAEKEDSCRRYPRTAPRPSRWSSKGANTASTKPAPS